MKAMATAREATLHLLPLAACHDIKHVGGKAANLGELIRSGFDVPDGFVITTDAFRDACLHHGGLSVPERVPERLAAGIVEAYRCVGGGAVAVRSSATAEDLADASMAGQYETFLDVRDEQSLLRRIRDCWASIDSPRTRAYLSERSIDLSTVAMAVVVQKLVHADVAGVLFSVNPRNADESQMLIEASWGLGEAVVSGQVQPDMLTLARADGHVIDAFIAEKRHRIDPASGGMSEVSQQLWQTPALRSRDIDALWKLALAAERHFGAPQDIEWAIENGRLYVLQLRSITTLGALREQNNQRDAVRRAIREAVSAGRGPWVLHNLAETLPHPTPLTWDIIRHFLSASGGFGHLYRMAGFEPSPALGETPFVDLLGGRIYMDLGRAGEMFQEQFPFRYDIDSVRHNPEAGQSPPSVPAGSIRGRVAAARMLRKARREIQNVAATLDRSWCESILPTWEQWLARESAVDLGSLSHSDLLLRWETRRHEVLDVFAPRSLLPSMIVGQVQADLVELLRQSLWDESPEPMARDLAALAPADETMLANQLLYQVGKGRASVDEWMDRYGHRGPEELDLISPRWRERTEQVMALAQQLARGAEPANRHEAHHAARRERAAQVRSRLPRRETRQFDQMLALLERYVPFRENGKHQLMRGYALLRTCAAEIGRRLEIGDGVFYLTQHEMCRALTSGFAPLGVIEARRRSHDATRTMALPAFLDEAWADGKCESPPHPQSPVRSDVPAAGVARGISLSAGVGRGVARVLEDPVSRQLDDAGYVLVCRSTDPSWTPLFVNAAAIVLETGGALSHGAIVAREMGVPAVVVPGARTLFQDGSELIVDGDRGVVARADACDQIAEAKGDDVSVLRHDRLPPAVGGFERRAARWRNIFTAAWLLVLGLIFLLPGDRLYEPALRVLDAICWPLMSAAGRAWGTLILGVLLGAMTMLLQRLLTDNQRLVVAKRRARLLQKEARRLAPGTTQRQALERAAAPVQRRLLGAAMVPIGLLLGPLVLLFAWLPARVDPASVAVEPGSVITLTATLSGEYLEPLSIDAPSFKLVSGEPSQRLPRLRETLEEMRAELTTPTPVEGAPELPWEVRDAGDRARVATIADLDEFLQNPIPPQPLWWRLRVPESEGIHVVTLNAVGGSPTVVRVAVGDRSPPQPVSLSYDASPIDTVEITLPPRPPAAPMLPLPFLSSEYDLGWLGLYLLGYLPGMFLTRALLGVP